MSEEGKEKRTEAESRPQRAGEAATTRFGMEETRESEVPATGGPQADEADEAE
jgi:hypothetical protein